MGHGTPLLERVPSIVAACDVRTFEALDPILRAAEAGAIGALKIGISLALNYGLPAVVKYCRSHTSRPLIYDHQKAGTDIPFTAGEFAHLVKGCDAAILFPQAGLVTQREWTAALQDAGVRVIVGAVMTHKGYLQSDGGHIADNSPDRILSLAIEQGVRDFIVPGTKPSSIEQQRRLIERSLTAGQYDLYAPGLVAQGGTVEDLRAAAGPRWHAIVGRGIYQAADPGAAAATLAETL